MTLYTPRHFASESREDALALIRTWPFATLVTTTPDGEPHITHLPLLLEGGEDMRFASTARSMSERPAMDGRAGVVKSAQSRQGRHHDTESTRLIGHMARANPHWQAFAAGHTVAVFHGPHAYISPNWYVDPAIHVPTWNYSAVHAHGVPTLIDDRAAKLAVVDATTAAFEPADKPWQRQVQGAKLEALLNAIVAFHIPLSRIEAKFKMGQNRSAADRAQVMAALRATAHPDLAAMADWMRAHEQD